MKYSRYGLMPTPVRILLLVLCSLLMASDLFAALPKEHPEAWEIMEGAGRRYEKELSSQEFIDQFKDCSTVILARIDAITVMPVPVMQTTLGVTRLRVSEIQILRGQLPEGRNEFPYPTVGEFIDFAVGNQVILGLKHDPKNDDYEVTELLKATPSNKSLASLM